MLIMGIDPGKEGGIAVDDGDVVRVYPMPVIKPKNGRAYYDEGALYAILNDSSNTHELNDIFVAVERQQAMFPFKTNRFTGKKEPIPHSSTASYSIGHGYGLIQGMLAAMQIPREYVAPKTWKAILFAGQKNRGKEASIERAKQLYPQVSLRKSQRTRKDHDGIADAILIMEYAKRVKGSF